MPYIIIGCLVVIILILIFYKQRINKSELALYESELKKAQDQYRDARCKVEVAEQEYFRAKNAREYNERLVTEYEERIDKAQKNYNELVNTKTQEINQIMENQREARQKELDQTFNAEKERLTCGFEAYLHGLEEQVDEVQAETNERIMSLSQAAQETQEKVDAEIARYKGLIGPIKLYEMEKQQRLYYTIQLPEEYQEDIDFLLTTVAAKVQHPDIISKLVWNEYVKNYLADTCKRVDIREEPGIYKLTSLVNGKSYIGKSTNVKKRIQDHFKSVVGIQSIADQAVHHAIRKEGFWNWTIEIVVYCEKEKLNELEKFYIDTFDTQNYGWNRNAGGGG